jgi:hypothetical protein
MNNVLRGTMSPIHFELVSFTKRENKQFQSTGAVAVPSRKRNEV